MLKTSARLLPLALVGLTLVGCTSPQPTPMPTLNFPTDLPLTATPPTENPIATVAATAEMHWKKFTAPESGYAISYPLELYSMRVGPRSLGALFPGARVLEPNDLFTYLLPGISTYTIAMVARENTQGLTLDTPAAVFADGVLIDDSAQDLAGRPIEQITLDGEAALRVTDLPIGLAGVKAQIVAIHNGRIYEIVVEPRTISDTESDDGWTERILATFEFVD